ncbi:MAG TPA: hypothetical protein VH643_07850 [Gemmataceae bacterium]|jgi:hypothetical protein
MPPLHPSLPTCFQLTMQFLTPATIGTCQLRHRERTLACRRRMQQTRREKSLNELVDLLEKQPIQHDSQG